MLNSMPFHFSVRSTIKILLRGAFLMLLLNLVVGCSNNNNQIIEKKFVAPINLKNYQRYIWLISNNSSKYSRFNIKTDNFLFTKESDIVTEIKKHQIESPDIPLEKLAWLFVTKNLNYSLPFTECNWQHHPELMFSSLGTGQCDDLSSVLAFLWKDLGFKSRVWSLNGHVVPEVYTNGKWQMYDPSYQVYYTTCSNTVAGVEDLSENISLILNNSVNINSKNIFSSIISNSVYLAELYNTKNDNYVNNWYDNKTDTLSNEFVLPGKSTIKFPVQLEQPSISYRGGIFPEYSMAQIQLPDVTSCTLKIPLVLFNINGFGKVFINNNKFTIGSAELAKCIQSSDFYISDIVFPGNHKDVSLEYLLNKKLTEEISSLTLRGKNIYDLKIELQTNNTYARVNKTDIDSIINHNYHILISNHENLTKSLRKRNELNDYSEAKRRIKEIIMLDDVISGNQKTYKVSLVHSRIDSISLIAGNSADKLFNKINSPELLIIFMSYAECLTASEIIMNLK